MLTPVNYTEAGERVLAAAVRVLWREGARALTMRNVATEAGITATAIYRHFPDRDALLKAVIREEYHVLLSYIESVPANATPRQQLQHAFDRYVDFALDRPNSYELIFVAPHGISIDRYPGDFRSGRSKGFSQLRTAVAACIASGEMRDGDPTDLALDLYAHMHGLVMLHRAGRFGGRDDVMRRFYRRSLERLL